MKKYKKSDLNVHIYGQGRDKCFIMYTDFEYKEGEGPRWNTRVYPLTRGNKANAIREALDYLNDPDKHFIGGDFHEPYVVRRPSKIFLAYKFGA